MEFRDLKNVPLAVIVDCLNEAFSGYYVKLPESVDYWERRFKGARVDLTASCGAFNGGKLVAFIIHGIDEHRGRLSAFNTGTGVLKEYRGMQLVDRLYDYILPKLRKRGVEKCLLEVIQENLKAVRVYERIGFEIQRELLCFSGSPGTAAYDLPLQQITCEDLRALQQHENAYSWDNSLAAIEKLTDTYQISLVKERSGQPLGYFVIDPATGYLAQIESTGGDYRRILQAVAQLKDRVRINNVDSGRRDLLLALEKAGLQNTLNQFEMQMHLA